VSKVVFVSERALLVSTFLGAVLGSAIAIAMLAGIIFGAAP
jgi:hypothetical protein